jgi:hypothetical protein
MRSDRMGWDETPQAYQLVNLFANHTAQEMTSTDGQRLIAAELQFPIAEYHNWAPRPTIREPFSKLLEIRGRVDLIVKNFPGNPDLQFRKAAALLKKYRKQNAVPEMRIAYKLAQSALVSGWDPELKKRFAALSEFFKEYKDYFLSYTNKDSGRTNTDFAKTFYPETKQYIKTCSITANLLARQVVEHLSGLSGFFDKQQILLGDAVRAKIVCGAATALVFIQLVSRAMLESEQNETDNWCFQEYMAYKCDDECACDVARGRTRLFIFLIAEKPVPGNPAEAVRPFSDLRDAYKPWHDHMLELATQTLERSSCGKLKEQIEVIARQIHEFRHSILDSVVNEEFAAGLSY